MLPVLPCNSDQKLVSNYQKRFAFAPEQIKIAPNDDLSLVVVLPVHNEPDLIRSLESLFSCDRPDVSTEVILVFNSSVQDTAEIRDSNATVQRQTAAWTKDKQAPSLQFHILSHPDLPPKHAGVGLARKIGMDEAANRFYRAGRLGSGIIACFDADCTCAPSFFRENVRHFEQNPHSVGCSTHFEHPLSGDLPEEVYRAAIDYELHLRYYVEALRKIRFPYAHHTVGSSMSVRAVDYLKLGGMNRKKAGEDFYFLQKLMTHGEVTELNSTTIYPSARISTRVPFGTGRAIEQALKGQLQTSYPWPAFEEIGKLVQAIESLQSLPSPAQTLDIGPLPRTIHRYLVDCCWEEAVHEIAQNVSELTSFKKRFWQWFNGFRCMKFLNWAAERSHPRIAVSQAAAEQVLCQEIDHPRVGGKDARSLLLSYRRHQQQHAEIHSKG